MNEYKIYALDLMDLGGRSELKAVEDALNRYAEQGWNLERFEDRSDSVRWFYFIRSKKKKKARLVA